MKLFRDMGHWVQTNWRQRHFDERAFPEVAMAALEKFPPAELASYSEFIQAWVFDDELPQNVAGKEFGQPAITAFSTERFFIEVLCWMESTTAVHQHGFSGAFSVMAGSSIHTTYAFEPRERIHSQLQMGRLVFQNSELLTKGSCRPIIAGSSMIHALFHLDRPSISVVIRTPKELDRAPQWSYQKPHIAFDPFSSEVDRRRRLTQTLDMLVRTDQPAYDRLVDRIVAESDHSLVFAALEQGHYQVAAPPFLVDEERQQEVDAAVIARFGRTGEDLVASCRRGVLALDLVRRREDYADRDMRLFLALLMNVPTRPAIFAIVAKHFDRDPQPLVQGWLRELTTVPGPASVKLLEIALDLEDPPPGLALDDLLHQTIARMLSGASGGELQRQLCEVLPPEAYAVVGDSISDLEARLRDSSLQPLFVT